jgi:type I restriction-modification system DNA methylase subunit
MTQQAQLGKTLWNIADQLRGAMSADDVVDFENQMRHFFPNPELSPS